MKLFGYLRNAAVLLAALAAMLPSDGALSQVVTAQPTYVNPGAVTDLGNGPAELRVAQGNALLSTSQGSGVGSTSGSSTSLALTAVPATPPCVGCIISGAGITSGTTVTAYNGVTSITMSAAMTVASSTPVAWGAACPTNPQAVLPVQASVGGDFPFFTQARLCAYSPNGPGAALLQFSIGAH